MIPTRTDKIPTNSRRIPTNRTATTGSPANPAKNGISPEEQERMLDAIQAQEDKTQEKLKEKAGVVVRGNKNW